MKKIILNIEGMTCSACSSGLEKYLKKQDGIIDASVNLVLATAMIKYDDKLKINDLNKFVENAGFKSLGKDKKQGSDKSAFLLLIIFIILIIPLMFFSMTNFINDMKIKALILLALTIPFLIYGYDILKNGIKNLLHGMPNMDSLVGIGVLVNVIYSIYNVFLIFANNDIHRLHNLYFEASAMIILFVKIGRYIDKNRKEEATKNIQNLVTITPKKGIVLIDGIEKEVTINEIKKGDIVICKPGEKIAVDGRIIKGETHTDESFITGESMPVSKKEGNQVIAGSINYDGYIEYIAEKIGKESSISNIVDLVVNATNTKTKFERFADKVSRYFVPIIFVIALLTFCLNYSINKNIAQAIQAMVSVLVVACPCALGLATPLAMVVSIGKCSKNGILIKNSEILEKINDIDTVIFDKTGTLTDGKMSIVDKSISKENMTILKAIEQKSNHPIAKAICYKNKNDSDSNLKLQEYKEISGSGIRAKINDRYYYAGNKKFVTEIISKKNNNEQFNKYEEIEKEYLGKGYTIVFLFDDNEILGIVGLVDKVKKSAKDTINRLKKINKQVIMLTGDNDECANKVALELGIENVYSGMTPKQKLDIVEKFNSKQNCIMVGDGINDSPALKTASIGVSVSGGTDISNDSSDILILKDDLTSICDLFKIGNKTKRIIKENLFWALFYNICMIPLATGLIGILINPMISSLAMTISSLTVVLNSLRLM